MISIVFKWDLGLTEASCISGKHSTTELYTYLSLDILFETVSQQAPQSGLELVTLLLYPPK